MRLLLSPFVPFKEASIFAALLLGLSGALYAIPTPILKFQMDAGTGTSVANTGSAGGAATKSGAVPAWSSNSPVNGGAYALDFGTSLSQTYFVDIPTPAQAKGLKSFTITGWLNCKDMTTGGGGNRILVDVIPGGTTPGVGMGIDLAYRGDGSLSLGVNQWNDWGGVHSHGGKITTNPSAPYNNWVFFAVTFNSLSPSGQVKFYFGTNLSPAELDIARDYFSGAVGTPVVNWVNTLTLGNMNLDNRYSGTNQMFRGLMDQIQLFGSTTDGSGELSAADIIAVQNATPLNGNGVLYEEFTNIGSGTAIKDLTTDPAYPNGPTSTIVRPTFDGFQYGPNKGSFGAKMSGWIKAPYTGNYYFWISSDDNGELRLSTDANPNNKRIIASVPGWVNYNEWEHIFTAGQPTPQKSAAIALVKDQYYYVEALMKEGTGDDHLTVQWQMPTSTSTTPTTMETPLNGSHVFLSPPVDGNFPSSYSMYDPGTSTKKATVGWRKDAGTGTFYLESDGTKAMTVQNGTAIFPDKLFFGGRFPGDPNDDDLGFRWDRPTQGTIGKLYLETQGGHWAMRTEAWSESEPHTEFNQLLDVTGPDATDADGKTWNGFATMDYMNGVLFDRSLQGLPSGQYYSEHSSLNGNNLTLTRQTVGGSTTTETTVIDAGQVTTPIVYATQYVTTPKWKVASQIPDYVFEKGYPLKSLEETERFVKEKKHLPGVPSAEEMSAQGVDLTEMNMKLLKKVEELTLHMIAMEKELKAQNKKLQAQLENNGRMEHEMRALRAGKGN